MYSLTTCHMCHHEHARFNHYSPFLSESISPRQRSTHLDVRPCKYPTDRPSATEHANPNSPLTFLSSLHARKLRLSYHVYSSDLNNMSVFTSRASCIEKQPHRTSACSHDASPTPRDSLLVRSLEFASTVASENSRRIKRRLLCLPLCRAICHRAPRALVPLIIHQYTNFVPQSKSLYHTQLSTTKHTHTHLSTYMSSIAHNSHAIHTRTTCFDANTELPSRNTHEFRLTHKTVLPFSSIPTRKTQTLLLDRMSLTPCTASLARKALYPSLSFLHFFQINLPCFPHRMYLPTFHSVLHIAHHSSHINLSHLCLKTVFAEKTRPSTNGTTQHSYVAPSSPHCLQRTLKMLCTRALSRPCLSLGTILLCNVCLMAPSWARVRINFQGFPVSKPPES